MALTFPNGSRSYDAARDQVRFLGHDGMFEVPFSIDSAALPKRGDLVAGDEAGNLAAFDAGRDTIRDAARRLYARGRQPLFVLTSADFK